MSPDRRPAPESRLSAADAFAQLSFLVQGTLERRAAERGLSTAQTRLLGILRDRRPTMHELARLLGVDKSSATGLVERAERRDLVARRRSTTDGRSVLVELTDSGRALVDAVAAGFTDEVTQLLEPLPPSRRATLVTLIERVLAAHAAEHGVDLHPESTSR